MGTIISILIFIVAVLLILVIMIQNPKGGLASNFSSSNQVMGVRRTADFLEKATWTLGISLVVLSILSSTIGVSHEVVNVNTDSELKEQIENIADPIQAPSLQQDIPVPDEEAAADE
ncbi:MAG TPA: preprotein translocase subunit SecG [Flavobacteriales bacterium]|nr:preprotein translocase subunit SecG [Flavobacteriales bacterium]